MVVLVELHVDVLNEVQESFSDQGGARYWDLVATSLCACLG